MNKNSKIKNILIGPCKISKSSRFSLFNLVSSPLNHKFFCIDGGIKHIKSLNLEKNRVCLIGDGDSTRKKMDIYKDNQDENDLSFALRQLIHSRSDIYLYGFSGQRTDHFLANLGEINQFLLNNTSKIYLDNNVIALYPGEHTVNINGSFSLMSIERNKVSLLGKCDFEIKNLKSLKPCSSFGLSNIGHGIIKIKCHRPLFIFLN